MSDAREYVLRERSSLTKIGISKMNMIHGK